MTADEHARALRWGLTPDLGALVWWPTGPAGRLECGRVSRVPADGDVVAHDVHGVGLTGLPWALCGVDLSDLLTYLGALRQWLQRAQGPTFRDFDAEDTAARLLSEPDPARLSALLDEGAGRERP